MKIYAALATDPHVPRSGLLYLADAGQVTFGPVRCAGEADNSGARAHGNVIEDPTQAYGDHPLGLYLIEAVVAIAPASDAVHHYGPYFLRLRPLQGQALEATRNKRSGFGLHGGPLHEDGRLRETLGCNRVDDDAPANMAIRRRAGLAESLPSIETIAQAAQAQLASGRPAFYECLELREPARLPWLDRS